MCIISMRNLVLLVSTVWAQILLGNLVLATGKQSTPSLLAVVVIDTSRYCNNLDEEQKRKIHEGLKDIVEGQLYDMDTYAVGKISEDLSDEYHKNCYTQLADLDNMSKLSLSTSHQIFSCKEKHYQTVVPQTIAAILRRTAKKVKTNGYRSVVFITVDVDENSLSSTVNDASSQKYNCEITSENPVIDNPPAGNIYSEIIQSQYQDLRDKFLFINFVSSKVRVSKILNDMSSGLKYKRLLIDRIDEPLSTAKDYLKIKRIFKAFVNPKMVNKISPQRLQESILSIIKNNQDKKEKPENIRKKRMSVKPLSDEPVTNDPSKQKGSFELSNKLPENLEKIPVTLLTQVFVEKDVFKTLLGNKDSVTESKEA